MTSGMACPRGCAARGVNLGGGKTSLADFKGKVVLVDFWATWCAPCVKAMPDLQKLHDDFIAKIEEQLKAKEADIMSV